MKTSHHNALTVLVAVLFAASLVVGCSTHRASQYISPRVEGRVLDSQTLQPIADVQVRRIDPGQEAFRNDFPHGGEIMQRIPPIYTDPDGTFVLVSQRDLVLFRDVHWYSVHVAFKRSGYERFTVTYTLANATNTAAGEPVVLAGDILLKPVRK